MVEPQIVVLVVAGSSPVGHPWNFGFSSADFRFANRRATAASSKAARMNFLSRSVVMVQANQTKRAWRDSNPQPSDPKSEALSG